MHTSAYICDTMTNIFKLIDIETKDAPALPVGQQKISNKNLRISAAKLSMLQHIKSSDGVLSIYT